MVAIGSIKGWTPGRGPVTTWTASPATLEVMARAERDPLPPSFQQASHLWTAYRAAQGGYSVPRLIMVAWDNDGWCDIDAMTEAINFHIRAHDTYHSTFDVSPETIVRRTVADPAALEFVPTALGFMEQDEIRAHLVDATPGGLEWNCFNFGVVQKEDHFTVYANIDHLYTDGTSAAVVYRDIQETYADLVAGRPAPVATAPGYRDFAARQGLQISAMTAESRPIKDWADFARETDGDFPTFPLPLGRLPEDKPGCVVTIELLDDAQTEAFENVCRAAGARFSGGVMAAAAVADHKLTGNDAFHIFTPSDTRSGEARNGSAGWYASLFPVSVEYIEGDFGQMARGAQKSFDSNRHLSAVPFRRVLDLTSAEELGVTLSSRPSMMVSLMDFRKLAGAEAHRLGIYIDDLSHGDVNMWVSRNPDQTIITVSFPDTAQARQSVQLYLWELRAAFQAAAASAPAVDTGYAHSAQLAG